MENHRNQYWKNPHRYIILYFLMIFFPCLVVSTSGFAGPVNVLIAQPKFEQRGGIVYLILNNTNTNCEVVWGTLPDVHFLPLSLDTNKVYIFTVTQKPIFPDSFVSELRKVQLEGRTVYDIEVCEIHNIRMEYKEVDIIYGLIRFGSNHPPVKIERQLFPHRGAFVLGGCVKVSSMPKSAKTYFCPECKKSYEKWKSELDASTNITHSAK